MASMTESSVAVVSVPVNAVQSFATIPAATTSLPLLTDPAHTGIYKSVDSSSSSATPTIGCTSAPLLVRQQYDPTKAFPAMVPLNVSTPKTSAIISSVVLSNSG